MKKNTAVIFRICILGAIGFSLIEPASALDYSSNAGVGFTFNEAISLSVSGDIVIDGLTVGGQKDSNVVSIVVSTNSQSGYTLSATVGDATHNYTDLRLDANNKFTSITASTSSLSDNTWGYKKSEVNESSWDTSYNALALYGGAASILRDTNTMPNNGKETTYFKIGAKASSNIIGGDYSNKITFYALAKVVEPVVDLCEGYQKMQDIATIKGSLGEEVQTQLCDARDGKKYWVAKLKDGNIWMTQNLDLNITAAGLSSADTDISTNWNSSSGRPPVATLTDASQYNNRNRNTSTASWDAGDWYYDGTSSTNCGSGKTTYEGCTGFSSTGNAHYHVGNMYSWGAATAGTGGDVTSGQATGSICPKGWRLPMSSGDPSFANLQSKGSLGSTVQNWLNAPYYFTRTGRLWYDSNKLYNAGNYGYYWSSTPRSDSSYAYFLGFNSSSYVSPAYNFGRAMGMAVRCVAW